jgi:hypothetical protein
MKLGLILFLVSLVIPNTFVRADSVKQPTTILHDPFKKPVFMQPSIKSKTVTKKLRQQPSWKPRLLMTLRAAEGSMANIGGQLVQLGEKVNGYKLIKVDEREVVLVNRGKTTRLTLDKDEK